jgi:hypothetical protein
MIFQPPLWWLEFELVNDKLSTLAGHVLLTYFFPKEIGADARMGLKAYLRV